MKKILIFLVAGLILLSSCSRKDPIKEDPKMSNFQVMGFVLEECPSDINAFIDSINQLDSVTAPDTIKTTINDTMVLLGIFQGREDKVQIHRWLLGQDSAFRTENNVCNYIVIDSTTEFKPIYKVTDNNGDQFSDSITTFSVINTFPYLKMGEDTLWFSKKRGADLFILAADTAGRVDSVKLDYDGVDGYDTILAYSDSVKFSFDFDENLIDTLGNQVVKIAIEDDDGNVTIDSIVVHFNAPPKLSLTFPFDKLSQDISKPFDFLWSASDEDNPDDMLFSLFITNKDKIVLRSDGIEYNFADQKWVASFYDADSNLVVNLPDSLKSGNLKWTVYVHDNYDTTFVETPYSFYLGDLDISAGNLEGYAIKKSMNDHSGLRVVLESFDGQYTYSALTQADGSYSVINIETGNYKVTVSEMDKKGWKDAVLDSIYIDKGVSQADTIFMIDDIKPKAYSEIIYNSLITDLDPRELPFAGRFLDSGSQVNPQSIVVTLNGSVITPTFDVLTSHNWGFSLNGLDDDAYVLEIDYADSVGNQGNTLTVNFGIKTKKVDLKVNGESSDIIARGNPIVFTANVTDAVPPIGSFIWAIYDGEITPTNFVFSDTTTTGTLNWSSMNLVYDGKIVVFADDKISSNGFYSTAIDTASFIVTDNSDVNILFRNPTQDTVNLAIGDVIDYEVYAVYIDGTITSYDWDMDGNGSFEITAGGTMQSKTFNSEGSFNVTARANASGGGGTAVVTSHVIVHSGAPTVQVKSEYNNLNYKINSNITLGATSSDEYGSIVKWEWSCDGGTWMEVSAVNGNPVDTVIAGPATPKSNYECTIRVTDDAATPNVVTDKITLNILADLPTVIASQSNLTVGIKDEIALSAVANDVLGSIVDISWKCGESSWLSTPDGSKTFAAPNNPVDVFVCVVKATDDDNQQAFDTTTVKVELRAPVVQVSTDSLIVGISENINLSMVAVDPVPPGDIIKKSWSCDVAATAGTSWFDVTGLYGDTTITSPSNSISGHGYWCIARVEDDDGLLAYDTMFIDVGSYPPIINSISSPDSININGTINLNVNATDLRGGVIVGYSWSCDNGSTWSTQVASSAYSVTAPSDTTSTFSCMVRVTDDDAQTTVGQSDSIKVVYDHPIVNATVDGQKQVITATTANKTVIAVASDDVFGGSIDTYEWSCGLNGVAGSGGTWNTGSSSYNTTMPGTPTAGYDYLCIVRVTDNDGMKASDTVKFLIESSSFVISLNSNAVFLNEGQQFQFVVSSNDDPSITDIEWSCDNTTNTPGTWTWQKYGSAIGNNFYTYDAPPKGTLVDETTLRYCGTRVQNDVGVTLTEVAIITIYHGPEAKITAPESLFVWSGNPALHSQTELQKYENFSSYLDASSSVPGSWGEGTINIYDWRLVRGGIGEDIDNPTFNEGRRYHDTPFVAYSDFYMSDSSIRENDDYVKVYLKLDIYDTNDIQNLDPDAIARHVAVDYDSITFYRAWEKLGNAPFNTANPGLTDFVDVAGSGTTPVMAYSIGSQLYVSEYSGSWNQIYNTTILSGSKFSIATTATGDHYLAFTNTSNNVDVFTNQSGSWAKLGSSISTYRDPVIKLAGTTPYIYTKGKIFSYNGSTWTDKAFNLTNNYVSGDMSISPNGDYLVMATQRTDNSGEVRAKVYNLNTGNTAGTRSFYTNTDLVAVAVDNSGNYFVSSVKNYVLETTKCNVSNSCSDFNGATVPASFDYARNTLDAAIVGSDYVVAFVEEQFKIVGGFLRPMSVISVWSKPMSGGDWSLYGEDHLPYFLKPYHGANYVISKTPSITNLNNRIHLGFGIEEVEVSGGPTATYNGTMMMRHRLPGQ